MINTL
ncbi:hypothetical protein BDFB_012292 [Asbolus verrucosus]